MASSKLPNTEVADDILTVPITVEHVIGEVHLTPGGSHHPVASMLHQLGEYIDHTTKSRYPQDDPDIIQSGFGVYRMRLPDVGTVKVDLTTEGEQDAAN